MYHEMVRSAKDMNYERSTVIVQYPVSAAPLCTMEFVPKMGPVVEVNVSTICHHPQGDPPRHLAPGSQHSASPHECVHQLYCSRRLPQPHRALHNVSTCNRIKEMFEHTELLVSVCGCWVDGVCDGYIVLLDGDLTLASAAGVAIIGAGEGGALRTGVLGLVVDSVGARHDGCLCGLSFGVGMSK